MTEALRHPPCTRTTPSRPHLPETATIDTVLAAMRGARTQVVVVMDEDGVERATAALAKGDDGAEAGREKG